MRRSESNFDRSELERIATELGYDGWVDVLRIPPGTSSAVLKPRGVRVADGSLVELITDAVEG
jgi:hypothetical protein